MQYLLVHSPLVGPSSWRWVADALGKNGHHALVPDLRRAVEDGNPDDFAAAAAHSTISIGAPLGIVGHSGAGPFLPIIASQLNVDPEVIVFVDAVLPPCEGSFRPSAGFMRFLEAHTEGQLLPKWSEWWSEQVMEELVPDDYQRSAFVAEMPRVPLSFYQRSLIMPPRWCDTRCAYLQLSDAYQADASRATSLGWTVESRRGTHMDIVNFGEEIAKSLEKLS